MYEPWRHERVVQIAAAWVLACVFVRFSEDNGLIPDAWLSGPGDGCSRCFRCTGRPRRCPRSGGGAVRTVRSCTTSRTRAEHPFPRRPVPEPVRARAKDVCAAPDAGVRGGVHPRPDAGTGGGEVRLGHRAFATSPFMATNTPLPLTSRPTASAGSGAVAVGLRAARCYTPAVASAGGEPDGRRDSGASICMPVRLNDSRCIRSDPRFSDGAGTVARHRVDHQNYRMNDRYWSRGRSRRVD